MGLLNYLQQLEDQWNSTMANSGRTWEDMARQQQSGVDRMSNQFNQMAGGRLFDGTMQDGVRVPIPQGPQGLPPEILEPLLRQQQMSMAAAQGALPNAIRDQSSFFDPQNNPYALASPDKPPATQPPWSQEANAQFPSVIPPVPEPPMPQAERQAAEQFALAEFSAPPAWMENRQQEFFSPNSPPPPPPPLEVSPETEAQAQQAMALGREDYELSRQGQLDRQWAEMGDRNLAGLQLQNSRFEPSTGEERFQDVIGGGQMSSQQKMAMIDRDPRLKAEMYKAMAAMDQQRQEEEAASYQAWQDSFDQDKADVAMEKLPDRSVTPTDTTEAERKELFAGAQGKRDERQETMRMRGMRKDANLTARGQGVPLPSAGTVAREDRIGRGVAGMQDYAMVGMTPGQMEVIQNEDPQFRRDELMKGLLANPGIMANASFEDLMSLINAGDGAGGNDPIKDPENHPAFQRAYGALDPGLWPSLSSAIEAWDGKEVEKTLRAGNVDPAIIRSTMLMFGGPGFWQKARETITTNLGRFPNAGMN